MTLILAAIVLAIAAYVGLGVEQHLSVGGYTPSSSESAQADALLAERFQAGSPDLVLVAHSEVAIDEPDVAAAGVALTRRLADAPGVVYAQSFWSTGDPTLRARDGRTGLVVVKLRGDDTTISHLVRDLVAQVTGRVGPFQVAATGSAEVDEQVDAASAADLSRAELLAAPLTFVILLIAFGSLVAAALPLLVGAAAVVATLAGLRLLSEFTDVSIFAVNLTTALGFGLAVDYSLFIVTRYREELAAGQTVQAAIATSMRTAGRTVLVSAITVALSLAGLSVFPLMFLRSLSYAGIMVVALAATASLVLLAPLLSVIGHRIDRLDIFARLRRRSALAGRDGVWHRLAIAVMRRPAAVAIAVLVGLLTLAIPFTHVHFGLTDDRLLPRDNPAHLAAETVRAQFEQAVINPVTVVAPRLDAEQNATVLTDYAQRLSMLPHAELVRTATGDFAHGAPVAGPSAASAQYARDGSSWLAIVIDVDPSSTAAEQFVRDARAVPTATRTMVGGDVAVLVDTKAALADRLLWSGLVIGLSMLVLLFLFTGSVVIAVQALLLNMVSLTASFGAMVYIFQDGHARWLVGDFLATGRLEVTVPVLMFCVAFGLSMDYTVFLLARITEHHCLTGDTARSIVFGLGHTGRLITAAAAIVATVLGALTTSHLSLLKLLGFGLAITVLVDATLVRGLLVPAVMRLLGRANWWAPAFLRRLHARIGLAE
jgi:putative drug exporter of the RND superfamily